MAIYHTRIKTYSRAKAIPQLPQRHIAVVICSPIPTQVLATTTGVGQASSNRVAWHHLAHRHGPMTRKHFGPLQKRQSDAATARCAETSPSRCRTNLMIPSAGI